MSLASRISPPRPPALSLALLALEMRGVRSGAPPRPPGSEAP